MKDGEVVAERRTADVLGPRFRFDDGARASRRLLLGGPAGSVDPRHGARPGGPRQRGRARVGSRGAETRDRQVLSRTTGRATRFSWCWSTRPNHSCSPRPRPSSSCWGIDLNPGAGLAGERAPGPNFSPDRLQRLLAHVLVGLAFRLLSGLVHVRLKVPPRSPPWRSAGWSRVWRFSPRGRVITIDETGRAYAQWIDTGILGFPAVVGIAVLLRSQAFVGLHHTRFDRHTFAVGAGEPPAGAAGVDNGRTMILALGISGTLASIAGILLAA